MDLNHDGASQTTNNAEQQQQTVAAHTISVADPYIAAQEAAWTLVTECRKVQWALMQLVTENIRLKSWDAFYINTASFLIGWDEPTIKSIRKVLNQGFYDRVASANNEDPGAGRKKILNLLVRDSSSVANSILGWLTMYILPCLYAFIGAAAAAMIAIRRKLNTSLLSYSDRGWVKQALILGLCSAGLSACSPVTSRSLPRARGLACLRWRYWLAITSRQSRKCWRISQRGSSGRASAMHKVRKQRSAQIRSGPRDHEAVQSGHRWRPVQNDQRRLPDNSAV